MWPLQVLVASLILAGCTDSQTPLEDSKVDVDAPEDSGSSEDTSSDVNPEDSGDSGDTQAPAPREGWFDPAVLDPPFLHGNAIWAGVAILDFDRDGRQDLFFTNGGNHPDALYRNLGEGRFEDVAAQAGVDSTARHGAVVSGDIDNDGDEDLVVTTECTSGTLNPETGRPLGDGNITIYENLGDGTFLERQPTLASGASDIGTCPVSIELADINRDGFLDLAIANGLDPDQIYPWLFFKISQDVSRDTIWMNDRTGDFVQEVPPEFNGLGAGLVSFTTLFLDVNEDGLLDRIVGHGGAPVETYLQRSGGDFMHADDPLHTEVPDGLWMGLAAADFDLDEQLEFYATNQGLSPLIIGYDNIPEIASHEILDAAVHTVDPHLQGLVTPFHGVVSLENHRLILSDEWTVTAQHELAGDQFDGYIDGSTGTARYPEWMNPAGLERYPWSWGVVALDVNADGYTDVAFTGNNCAAPMNIIWDEAHGAGPGGLFLNMEGAYFKDVTWKANIPNIDGEGRYQDGRGIAVGDLNGDGYPDLVYVNRNYNPSQSDPLAQVAGESHVWLSRPRDGNWLRVEVVGTDSNRQGLGTTLILDDGEKRSMHAMGIGGGTNSSSERAFLLGLGSAEDVRLEITFPSGELVVLDEVEANQSIVVEEP